MKYKMDVEEKNIIKKFQSMRIPVIFKTDKTDRILFLEYVDFFVSDLLLKGKKISDSIYYETLSDYERFINNTDVSEFDAYTLEYFNYCMRIIEIMKKYYLR